MIVLVTNRMNQETPLKSPYYGFTPPNGVRYPLVGGTRQRHFDGTHFKPRKLPENAQTPISRVHAVLGGMNARLAN